MMKPVQLSPEKSVRAEDVYSLHKPADWLPLARQGVVPPATLSEGRISNFMPGYDKVVDMAGDDERLEREAVAAKWRPPAFFVRGFHDEQAVRRMTYRRLGRTHMFVAQLSLGQVR
jgi:hypothetical protein